MFFSLNHIVSKVNSEGSIPIKSSEFAILLEPVNGANVVQFSGSVEECFLQKTTKQFVILATDLNKFVNLSKIEDKKNSTGSSEAKPHSPIEPKLVRNSEPSVFKYRTPNERH